MLPVNSSELVNEHNYDISRSLPCQYGLRHCLVAWTNLKPEHKNMASSAYVNASDCVQVKQVSEMPGSLILKKWCCRLSSQRSTFQQKTANSKLLKTNSVACKIHSPVSFFCKNYFKNNKSLSADFRASAKKTVPPLFKYRPPEVASGEKSYEMRTYLCTYLVSHIRVKELIGWILTSAADKYSCSTDWTPTSDFH